jgi:hypothetical protein
MKTSRRDLLRRRKRILKDIERIRRLRRGQLSEQYITRPNRYGGTNRFGPYYILQSWRDGRKRSERVGRDRADQVRRDVEAYKRLKDLMDEYIDVTEELTLHEDRLA